MSPLLGLVDEVTMPETSFSVVPEGEASSSLLVVDGEAPVPATSFSAVLANEGSVQEASFSVTLAKEGSVLEASFSIITTRIAD